MSLLRDLRRGWRPIAGAILAAPVLLTSPVVAQRPAPSRLAAAPLPASTDSGGTPAAAARDWVSLRARGAFGGDPQAVTVVDGRAYFGVGPNLEIVDLARPDRPVLLSRISELPGLVTDVAVTGAFAYLALRDFGLVTVDLRTARAPAVVSSVPIDSDRTANEGPRLTVAGSRLYFAANAAGLRILSLADAAHPEPIGAWPGAPVADVAVTGNTAILAAGILGIVVLDVADAATPRMLAAQDAGFGAVRAVTLSDTTLLFLIGRSLVQSMDISELPELSGGMVFGMGDDITGLAALPSGILLAMDSGDPTRGRLLQLDRLPNGEGVGFRWQMELPGNPRGLAVSGSNAFVATSGAGLNVVDITPGSRARLLGTFAAPAPRRGLVVDGDLAFAATLNGFDVFDVRDPAQPRRLARHDGGTTTLDLVRSGPTLCRGFGADTRRPGVEIVDVSDAAQPRPLGEFALPEPPGQLVADEPFLYVLAGAGLRILDLSDPRRPFEAGAIRLPHSPQRLAVSQGLAALTIEQGDVQFVDVRDAAAPHWRGSFMPDAPPQDIVLSGTTAYIATSKGVEVVDVGTPAAARRVGRYPTDFPASRLSLSGQVLFVATSFADRNRGPFEAGQGAVQVVDVSDPTAPRSDSRYVDFSDPRASGNKVFLVNDWGGVSVFQLLRGGRAFLPVTISGDTLGRRVDAGE